MPKPHIHFWAGEWHCGEWNYRGKFCSLSGATPLAAYEAWLTYRRNLAASGIYWEYYPDGGRRP